MAYINLKDGKDEAWYRGDGTPVYGATLREARKENLLPRVTNILRIINKEELVDWRIEQGILAAVTLPRQEQESIDDWVKRVVTDSKQQARDAADWGTAFHELIESHMRGNQVTPTPPFAPMFERWLDWFGATGYKAVALEEVVVNNAFGYAGRMDHLLQLNGEIVISDTKTRSVKNGKPLWYDEQAMQLAAYSRCLPYRNIPAPTKCMSVIINRDTPESPYVKMWTEDEIELGWRRFRAALTLWQEMKKYAPNT